jgi:hypothetical protein
MTGKVTKRTLPFLEGIFQQVAILYKLLEGQSEFF